ncbi:MAG: hypothetical protein AAFM92_01875 [Pseudomonadota bacterium]
METFPLLAILALTTFTLVIIGAMRSKKKTLERKEDDGIPKSSLAADAPSDRQAP